MKGIQPRLPKSILDQIQDSGSKNSGSRQSLKNTRKQGRKDRRKQQRLDKKQARHNNARFSHQADGSSDSESSDDEPEPSYSKNKSTVQPSDLKKKTPNLAQKTDRDDTVPTKKVEVTKKVETTKPAIRKAVAEKLDEDDAEIAALEKKLNIKGKKLPTAFKEDNLDWLLDGFDSEDDELENDRQYLAEKRGKKRKRNEEEEHGGNMSESGSEDFQGSDEDMLEDSDISGSEDEGSEDVDMEDAEGDWSGFSSDADDDDHDAGDSHPPAPKAKLTKPDPTKPAITADQPTKYIPPAQRRKLAELPTDDMLRKKIQGQVNRLTEQSMLQIVKSIEELYREYPRQSVTSTLTTLVLASVSNEVNTRETFFTLYGGFIAALYRILGTDFGAHFVQNLVEDFDKSYGETVKLGDDPAVTSTSPSKKQVNDLVSLLAELYNFGVVGSSLVFDVIRIFTSEVAELNAELLLKIVRSSGPQLRQDDPTALKDIVSMLNVSVAKVGTDKLSTRFKFMIETLSNLKNNKARKTNDASVVASEAIVRMKKTLGTLNSRSLRATEPLRPSLKDIREVETKGKWWLVGASWRNNMLEDEPKVNERDEEEAASAVSDSEDDIINYQQLAREQRMNTDIRRAIFTAIMDAGDYTDAREKLFKLRLKKNQEREIPHVLLHCCGNEAQYNPYYALIAQQLCTQHPLRMAFQFSLWEVFRKMGEEDDMNRGESHIMDEDEDGMPLRKIVNLAKLYGYLVAHRSLSLKVLKTLQLVSVQPSTKNFLEVFFITLFSQIMERYPGSSSKRESRLRELFRETAENPSLSRGLEYFLKKNVAGSDITNGKKEKKAVKQGCEVAAEVLRRAILDGTEES
ncbi:suppressor of glycerol defect [Orbilia oligospora]|uniref:Suppressor of glycerol defect n=1 Tax=Orbilia oligospora TaxID=2813651 RepID=A0A7C8V989_ORBOL|nr:suppressor of glycerol defect [Orbilia oligospora]